MSGDFYQVTGGQNTNVNIGRGNRISTEGGTFAPTAGLIESISTARARAQNLPDGTSRTEFLDALDDFEADVQARAPRDKLERRLGRLKQWGESLDLGLTVLKIAEALTSWAS